MTRILPTGAQLVALALFAFVAVDVLLLVPRPDDELLLLPTIRGLGSLYGLLVLI